MYISLLSIIFFVINSTVHAEETNSVGDSMNFSKNLTQIYEKYLGRIFSYCMSEKEFEELYGNKSKFGLVFLFAPLLMSEACKQIGLNELRHQLNLKPQLINLTDLVEETFEEDGKTSKLSVETIEYFQQRVKIRSRNWLSDSKFWSEDIQNAENFLNRKFPEIRRLFQKRFNDEKIISKSVDTEFVDKLVLIFTQTQGKIFKALEYSAYQSSHGLYEDVTSNCYIKEV